jgi:hypothetical protein
VERRKLGCADAEGELQETHEEIEALAPSSNSKTSLQETSFILQLLQFKQKIKWF